MGRRERKLKRKARARRVNKKVVWFSIIALICLVLGFVTHWIFVVPAVIFMIINQKELVKRKD